MIDDRGRNNRSLGCRASVNFEYASPRPNHCLHRETRNSLRRFFYLLFPSRSPPPRQAGVKFHSMPPRGNPEWFKPMRVGPAMASEFEKMAQHLRLTPATYADSPELRSWCERNCNRCYIPEWLLQEWKIDVDADLAPHRSR